MAKLNLEKEMKEHSEYIESLKPILSKDGKEINGHQQDSLLMIIGDATKDTLDEIGKYDLVKRMVDNLIAANTAEDIDALIQHIVASHLARLFSRRLTTDYDRT